MKKILQVQQKKNTEDTTTIKAKRFLRLYSLYQKSNLSLQIRYKDNTAFEKC